YTFEGWYNEANFSGNKVENIAKGSTGDRTFYAKWEEAVNKEEVAGNDVQELIEQLPSFNNVTLEHKNDIEKARVAYDQLSEDAKTFVTNVGKLELLEQKISNLEEEAAYEAKKAELEETIEEILELDTKNLTNESAIQLGSSVGQAENLLRLSNDMSDDGIVQAFTEAITTMNTAMNNISYKTDEDEETVITSHAHFETSRLNEYTLDDES